MKKFGILIFIFAIAIGVTLANVFSFGKTSSRFFNFQIDFGKVKGSGNVVTQVRDVRGFDALDVSGAMDVEVVAQKEFSVEVEGDDNLLGFIRTEVRGNKLYIDSQKRYSTNGRIRIRIGAPDIERLDVSGASIVSIADLKNSSLTIDSSGASKIKVTGQTNDLTVDMSGASKFEAFDLKAQNANIDASGACQMAVFVAGDLKADLSGASKLNYEGSPKNIQKKTSGASSVSGN